jgi:flavorubredoxin
MHPREIVPGVWWLGGCHEVPVIEGQPKVGHTHTAAYLLLGSEKTLLVDTGHAEKWADVRPDLERCLGGRTLDYIFPTHTETPHAGNLPKLLRLFPKAQVVGDTRDWHLLIPQIEGRLVERRVGESVDLGGGQRFVFLESLIRDLPSTLWAYDTKNRIMFVADGFSYTHNAPLYDGEIPIHADGQCSLVLSEWPIDPVPGQVEGVMTRALYTMRFIKLDELAIDRMPEFFKDYPTDIIAPAHGSVIDNVDRMLPIVKEAHRSAYAHRPKA